MIDRHPDGVVLTVWVVPGASRSEVVGRHGDALRVRVAAPPEGGKANDAAVGLLSAHFGVDRAVLVSGAGSRRKRIVLLGAVFEDVVAGIPDE